MTAQTEIDWRKELQGVKVDVYYYFVSSNPDEIQEFVTDAVYETLAGPDVRTIEEDLLIKGKSAG